MPLYGQEINALTSAIARMNLFLHGIEDFQIVNGDTLAAPAFIERGKLKSGAVMLSRQINMVETFWEFLHRDVLITRSCNTL